MHENEKKMFSSCLGKNDKYTWKIIFLRSITIIELSKYVEFWWANWEPFHRVRTTLSSMNITHMAMTLETFFNRSKSFALSRQLVFATKRTKSNHFFSLYVDSVFIFVCDITAPECLALQKVLKPDFDFVITCDKIFFVLTALNLHDL